MNIPTAKDNAAEVQKYYDFLKQHNISHARGEYKNCFARVFFWHGGRDTFLGRDYLIKQGQFLWIKTRNKIEGKRVRLTENQINIQLIEQFKAKQHTILGLIPEVKQAREEASQLKETTQNNNNIRRTML